MIHYNIQLKNTHNTKLTLETILINSANLLLIDRNQLKIVKINNEDYSAVVSTNNYDYIIDITGDSRIESISILSEVNITNNI